MSKKILQQTINNPKSKAVKFYFDRF